MKVFREHEVEVMLDELSKFITDLHQGKPRTMPRVPEGIEITEAEIDVILKDNLIEGTYGTITSKATKAILSKLNEP